MHAPIGIAADVYWVGANDTSTDWFEGLWPLPAGVSLNSYLITGPRTVLVDTVSQGEAGPFLETIRSLLGGRALDLLVVNHLEPDHSGALRAVVEAFPDVELIGTKKAKGLVDGFYGLGERLRVVADGEELDVGGRVLRFVTAPMVHWPETMMTYDAASGVLFSGDAFGAYGALADGLFDDQVDRDALEPEILRYYANIVAKYSVQVHRAIAKAADLDVKAIAPTHGPVWRSDPKWIVDRYDRYSRQQTDPSATVLFGSMYGGTKRAVDAVTAGLAAAGVTDVCVHDVTRSHLSFILRDVWRSRAIVVGSPIYDGKLFPLVDHVLRVIGGKKPTGRLLGLVGMCAWSGGVGKALREATEGNDWELVEPVVEIRCASTAADLAAAEQLGRELGARIGSA